MSSRIRTLTLCLACLSLALLLFTGCAPSGGTPVVPASGTILYNGEPLEGAMATFFPASDGGRESAGTTDSKGVFLMITAGADKTGCVPGKYKVSISKQVMVDSRGNIVVPHEDLLNYSYKELLPKKYQSTETSGFEIEVARRGKNQFTFELDDQ